jgi:hypothetical protein
MVEPHLGWTLRGAQEYPEKTIGLYSFRALMPLMLPDSSSECRVSPDLFVFEASADEGFTCSELMEVRMLVARRSQA